MLDKTGKNFHLCVYLYLYITSLQAKISQIPESLMCGNMTFCCHYTSSTLVDSRTGYQTRDHNIVAVELARGSHIVIRKARPMIGLTRRNFSACSRGTNTDWNSKHSQILVPFQVDSVPFFKMSVWCLIEYYVSIPISIFNFPPYLNSLIPQILKMCPPILATLMKMKPDSAAHPH